MIVDRRQCKSAEKAGPQQMAALLQGAPKNWKKYDCKISENSHFHVCHIAIPPLGAQLNSAKLHSLPYANTSKVGLKLYAGFGVHKLINLDPF